MIERDNLKINNYSYDKRQQFATAKSILHGKENIISNLPCKFWHRPKARGGQIEAPLL